MSWKTSFAVQNRASRKGSNTLLERLTAWHYLKPVLSKCRRNTQPSSIFGNGLTPTATSSHESLAKSTSARTIAESVLERVHSIVVFFRCERVLHSMRMTLDFDC